MCKKKTISTILVVSILVAEFVFRLYDDAIAIALSVTFYMDNNFNGQVSVQSEKLFRILNFLIIDILIIYPLMAFFQSLEILLLMHLVANDFSKRSVIEDKTTKLSFKELIGDSGDFGSDSGLESNRITADAKSTLFGKREHEHEEISHKSSRSESEQPLSI